MRHNGDLHVIEFNFINVFLVLFPYTFALLIFNITSNIYTSILTFLFTVPISYALIYYVNNLPFN